jgi:glucose-1-phosphate thymidylyltransferase
LKNLFRVGYKEITGWWKDTGKPNDLLVANALLMDHMNDTEFNQIGKVKIGTGAKIDPSVKIIGPSIIGENCVLKNCVIGPHVSLGSGSSIDGAIIKESIIRENTSITGSISLHDSLIGREVEIRLPVSASFISEKLILGDKTVVEQE